MGIYSTVTYTRRAAIKAIHEAIDDESITNERLSQILDGVLEQSGHNSFVVDDDYQPHPHEYVTDLSPYEQDQY